MEYEGDGDTNCNWYAQNNPKDLVKKQKDLEIWRRTETIKTTALLRSARILWRVQ